MAEVVLKNVTKRYGNFVAVKQISTECKDREFLVILGPSGCGKTSTLRMIAGLIDIDEGEIWIGSRMVNDLNPEERNVAMAFENYALYPTLTVYDNIAFPLRVRKVPEPDIKKKVSVIAETLQITEILSRKPAQLSGGQQQRTSLARALIRDADVYLLDEPISHLDAKLRSELRSELKRIHEDMKRTFIYITHDQLEGMALADRLIIMNQGIIQQIDPPFEIFARPANLFVAGFIGEPPMNFVDCDLTVEDGRGFLRHRGFNVAVPPERQAVVSAAADNGGFIVGVRPQHIKALRTQSEQTCMSGRVVVNQELGEKDLLTVNVEELTILVEVAPELQFQAEDVVHLELPSDKFYIFNARTQQTIY